MRWRYIKIGLIGGMMGFASQFVGDFLGWYISGKGPYPYQYARNQRVLATCVPAQSMQQANQLLWQAVFLAWLRDRTDLAGRNAAIVAFIGVSTMLAADQLQEKRKARREATVS